MAEYPKYEKEDAVMAALCYFPFLLNFLMPLYILLGKKGGKFAKFHALQGFSIAVLVFVIMFVLQMLLLPSQLGALANMGNMNNFQAVWGQTVAAMLPLQILNLVYILAMLYVTYIVYSGKEFAIPQIMDHFKGKY